MVTAGSGRGGGRWVRVWNDLEIMRQLMMRFLQAIVQLKKHRIGDDSGVRSEAGDGVTTFNQQVADAEQWFARPRFAGIVRLYSPREVAEQQGTILSDYTVVRRAGEEFCARLRELFDQRNQITTFGPYSPGQTVALKRIGMEGIYLGRLGGPSPRARAQRIRSRTWRATR